MPFVRITARDSRSRETVDAVGNAIHDALVGLGRTDAAKRAFYARAAALAQERAAVRPADLFIVLRENDLPDWSFGEGIAQYAQL